SWRCPASPCRGDRTLPPTPSMWATRRPSRSLPEAASPSTPEGWSAGSPGGTSAVLHGQTDTEDASANQDPSPERDPAAVASDRGADAVPGRASRRRWRGVSALDERGGDVPAHRLVAPRGAADRRRLDVLRGRGDGQGEGDESELEEDDGRAALHGIPFVA